MDAAGERACDDIAGGRRQLKYSVSATCLTSSAFGENIAKLAERRVDDLHCDFFPQLSGAPSLTIQQLEWCAEVWPRQLTIHAWGNGVAGQLRRLDRRARVIIQLASNSRTTAREFVDLASDGWRVGIGVDVMAELPDWESWAAAAPVAVQLLSTSTPGWPGGTFVSEAIERLKQLNLHRECVDGDWSIEVDGGVTRHVVSKVRGLCDLAVLGTNYMTVDRSTGLTLPDLATSLVP